MKCKEVIRSLTYGQDAKPTAHLEITRHTMTCQKCREEVAVSAVIKSIVKHHEVTDDEYSVWDELRLVNQVKARIQSAKESGFGSWESAVISIRGWLVGFAAAAVLLLILSGQLAVHNANAKKDEGKLDLVSSAQTLSIGDDLISSNTQINRQSESNSEEVKNVR
ncbi:MAG: hypothetical protein JST85_29250 [Acidobacteria bacterium]|nr:hypothetical protein [Acidobacteriota bacterium]